MFDVVNDLKGLGYTKALVLSAGPSLKSFNLDYIRSHFNDCLIVTVKQSYKILDFEPHVHFYNEYNYENCLLEKSIIITSSVKGFKGSYFKRGSHHIEIDPLLPNITDNMSKGHLLSENLLVRGVGPGIMYEAVLPILFGSGIRDIFVVGWDLGSVNTEVIPRFYEKRSILKAMDYFFYRSNLFYPTYLQLENKLRRLFYLFGARIVLNNPGISPGEAARIAASSGKMYDILSAEGVNLTVISNVSLLDKKIPRWVS